MPYFLQSFRGKRISIEQREAATLNIALDSTFAQIGHEELWDAVTQNLADLERDLMNNALDNMLFGGQDWSHYQDVRTLFGRRLSNLLSSCRAYIDLAPRQLRKMASAPGLADQFGTLKSEAYDASFSYRFMEALRNYTQHYGSPINSTHLDSRRIEQPSGDQLRYVTAASIDPAALLDDTRFKASVRKELVGMGKLEVNKYAREYVERLAGVHVAVRAVASAAAIEMEGVVSTAIDRIESVAQESDFGAYLVTTVEGTTDVRRSLLREPFERLRILRRRNGSLHNLGIRYASGELLGDKLR